MSLKRGTLAQRKARSKSLMGHVVSSETRRKISASLLLQSKAIIKRLTGRPVSEKTRAKISASLKGHIHSEATRAKIGKSIHRLMTKEHKQKMRERAIAMGWPKAARKKSEEFNRNFVFTQEMREKIRFANSGKHNWKWKGGVVPLSKMIRHSFESQLWRQRIFKRDKFKCLKCNTHSSNLTPHHKKAFSLILSKFLKLYSQFSPMEDKETLVRLAMHYKPFWKVSNGVTLCRDCHETFHCVYGRRGDTTLEQWNEFIGRSSTVQLYPSYRGVVVLKNPR
jgi:hypothetical protein